VPSLFRIAILKLGVSEEQTYVRPMNSPDLFFSITSLRNFSHTNKNEGPFLSVSVTKYSRYPISYVAVEAKFKTDLLEPDNIRSLFQVYVIYIKDSSLCCCEHYGMTDPFA